MAVVALFSKIVPKSKGLSLYGSMNGYSAVDNSKYAYIDDVGSKNKFFILKNKKNLSCKLPDGSFPVYAYSVKGIILQLRAERVYFSHGIFDFVSPLVWGSVKHNLWHGVPIKEIGPVADWKTDSKLKVKIKSAFYRVFGHMYYMSCDYVYCPSVERVSDYMRFFSVSNPSVVIKEQPRNVASSSCRSINNSVLYAPTYRKYISTPGSVLDFLNGIGLYDPVLSSYLNENKISLVIRPHPIDRDVYLEIELPTFCSLDISEDLYESLGEYMAVITDYSSVYFDCVERNLKSLFIAPDFDQYTAEVGLTKSFVRKIEKEKNESILEALRLIRTE